MNVHCICIIPFITTVVACKSMAAVQLFHQDQAGWETAVSGNFTTIDFVLPNNPTNILTEEYAAFGIHFVDGNDVLVNGGPGSYPEDGWGLSGAVILGTAGDIHITFDAPQMWMAAHFPGDVGFELYSQGTFIEFVPFIGGGIGNYGGFISEIPFDEVIIIDFSDAAVFIDNLYFGVPAPGALPLLGLAVLLARSRRRDA